MSYSDEMKCQGKHEQTMSTQKLETRNGEILSVGLFIFQDPEGVEIHRVDITKELLIKR